MTDAYDPYVYFVRMAKKHGLLWRALFIVPNSRTRASHIRILFNALEAAGMPTQINTKKSELTTNNQSVAIFKIAFKGLITSLNGHEFQQIDGTEYLTKSDEEKIRPLLRTHVSLALAQDMVIR